MGDIKPYALIDSGNFLKLEQVGPYKIIRPSLQAIWAPSLKKEWEKVDGTFHRSSTGHGSWDFNRSLPETWKVQYGRLVFQVKLTAFGHIGLFPEQLDNHDWIFNTIQKLPPKPKVINLFAYTGASSLVAAKAGARVCHVDAAKGIIDWGKKNYQLSQMNDEEVRWICDDVLKFVLREKKRQNTYEGIILDPPSFGRGAKKEIWKIEEHLLPLLQELKGLMSPSFSLFLLSGHTPGYTARALENLLPFLDLPKGGTWESGEMVNQATSPGLSVPSGTFLRWSKVASNK